MRINIEPLGGEGRVIGKVQKGSGGVNA